MVDLHQTPRLRQPHLEEQRRVKRRHFGVSVDVVMRHMDTHHRQFLGLSGQSEVVQVCKSWIGAGLLPPRQRLHIRREPLMFHHELPDTCVAQIFLPALFAQKIGTVHILPDIRGTRIIARYVILVLQRGGKVEHGPYEVYKLGVSSQNPCS